MIDSFYCGWKPVDIGISKQANQKLEICEYFHSVNLQRHEGFRYKMINNDFILAKFVCVGQYSAIKYCDTKTSKKTDTLLLEKGFTLRGSDVTIGQKNSIGAEFVYDSNEFLKMEGSNFKRPRYVIKNMKDVEFLNGYHRDMDIVAERWSKQDKSYHQIKLLNFLKLDRSLITTRAYYKNEIIGFSIVEKINGKNSVIIQQLINPNIMNKLKEPNIIIHYGTCLANPDMLLNIGCARSEGIRIAKDKLVPKTMLEIKRVVSKRKLTKTEWETLKGTRTLTTRKLCDII